MPSFIERTSDSEYALISVLSGNTIKGVNSVNEEFMGRMRTSVNSFYNSSVIGKEAVARETLKDTLIKLHELLTWSIDKKGYMQAPEQSIVERAENWLIKLFLEAKELSLPWIKPNVTANAGGEVVFEWWYSTKKLTIYIDGQGAEYVQVWGVDIDSPISDGDAESTDAYRSLWVWLMN